MRSAEQRRWEAEQSERIALCPHCERPMVDASSQYVSVACQCPFCQSCGAHGPRVETTIIDDDQVCRACRDAEGRRCGWWRRSSACSAHELTEQHDALPPHDGGRREGIYGNADHGQRQ
jgi:hypothetical protein